MSPRRESARISKRWNVKAPSPRNPTPRMSSSYPSSPPLVVTVSPHRTTCGLLPPWKRSILPPSLCGGATSLARSVVDLPTASSWPGLVKILAWRRFLGPAKASPRLFLSRRHPNRSARTSPPETHPSDPRLPSHLVLALDPQAGGFHS